MLLLIGHETMIKAPILLAQSAAQYCFFALCLQYIRLSVCSCVLLCNSRSVYLCAITRLSCAASCMRLMKAPRDLQSAESCFGEEERRRIDISLALAYVSINRHLIMNTPGTLGSSLHQHQLNSLLSHHVYHHVHHHQSSSSQPLIRTCSSVSNLILMLWALSKLQLSPSRLSLSHHYSSMLANSQLLSIAR